MLFVAPVFGQNNIKKTAAVTYTQGPPTYTVLLPSSSEIAVDTTTGKIYQFHRTTSTWLQLGQGIDVISGSIPPAYTPLRNQSLFAINAVDSLYHYRSGAWRHLNAGGGSATTNGHVLAGNGTPVAQKDTADFIDNDIQFSVSNASTRTQVSGTIAADSVNSTHIQAGAVGNSELASNAVDSSKICAGCVSVTDIGQHGATSGQGLSWNGTQWAPASVTSDDIPLDHIPIGTGTALTYDYAIQANRTATDGQEAKIRLSMKDAGTTDHGIVIDSVLSTNTAYVVDITNPSTSAGSGFFLPYRARYTGSAAVDLYSVLSSSSTDSGADVFLSLGAASGGGDPSIAWSSGVTNNLVIAGIDNSSTGDLWKVDYLTTGSNMDGTYAIGVDNANRVGIGGDPVTGKALKVTGEVNISDLTVTSFTPVDIVAAESDGDLGRLKIGTGLSISNDTLKVASTIVTGSGTAGQVTYWGPGGITGEAAFTYNDTTNTLGVGATTPVIITETGITTAAAYAVGGSSNALTLSSSGMINLSQTGSSNGIAVAPGYSTTLASGTKNWFNFAGGFTPSSGTGVVNHLTFLHTINQTGGANGITRSILIDPTLTAVSDYRALEIAANSANAKGVYQIGTSTTNNFAGQTRFGSTSAPARMLDVTGEVRISDLTTDPATGLVGTDADGDLSRLKIGSNLSISNDTLHSTASGTVDGTGAAWQVAFWSDSNTITGEDSLFYNSSTNRLGVNTNVPDNKVTVKTNTATDGIQIESDGTAGQDPGWVRFKATQTGPLTQYGWMTLDGDSPAEGQGYIFKLQTTGYSVHTPLSLFKNQAIFSSTSQFYITNNAAGRFIFSVPSAYDHNFQNNVLVTGSTFTTADTTIRLSVVGRTQTSASWGLRVWDGNKQSVFQVRDDARVGITATTLDASLTINGAGATSGTYGLMVTPSGGTTTTGTLVVRDDNRVGIRTNAPQTPLNVVGTGTTSGTTALLVEGSGGQDNLNVRDDGVNIGQGFAMASSAPSIAFASAAGTGPVNDLCSGGANGFVLFFTTGTSPGTNAAIFTATLPKSYPNGVIATWSCGDTDCLDEAPDIYISGTGNNSVTLSTRSTLTASTAYVVYVTCFGY